MCLLELFEHARPLRAESRSQGTIYKMATGNLQHAISNILGSFGISASQVETKPTVYQAIREFCATHEYETVVVGSMQWGMLTLHASPQEAAFLRFDITPLADVLERTCPDLVRDIRIKVA